MTTTLLSVVPVAGDPARLLCAGVRVFCARDGLLGWTVNGEIGGTLVHAPTEGDGDVHPLDEDPWSLLLWEGGSVVEESWDRVRRVLYRAGLWPTPAIRTLLGAFDPDLADVEAAVERLIGLGHVERAIRQ